MIKFRVLALTPVVPYGRPAPLVSRGDPERLFHLLEAKILLADPSCDSADFRVRFIVDGLTTQGTRNVICAAIHIAGGVIILRPTLARVDAPPEMTLRCLPFLWSTQVQVFSNGKGRHRFADEF